MNRDEAILVSRNVFGVSPGCYISMNSFLGRKNLRGFFRRDLPRESGKCMIQFDDDNFKWVGRKHQLNFVFSQLPNWSRYPWRASQDSSECFPSHCWLRNSAVGAPGAVESMAITF